MPLETIGSRGGQSGMILRVATWMSRSSNIPCADPVKNDELGTACAGFASVNSDCSPAPGQAVDIQRQAFANPRRYPDGSRAGRCPPQLCFLVKTRDGPIVARRARTRRVCPAVSPTGPGPGAAVHSCVFSLRRGTGRPLLGVHGPGPFPVSRCRAWGPSLGSPLASMRGPEEGGGGA